MQLEVVSLNCLTNDVLLRQYSHFGASQTWVVAASNSKIRQLFMICQFAKYSSLI